MKNVIVYGISLVVTIGVCLFSMGAYDLVGSDITIVNVAMLSAGIATGIIAGRCILEMREWIYGNRYIWIILACFLIPIVAWILNISLVEGEVNYLVIVLKYIQLGFYMITGIIPSLILNGAYTVLLGRSENAAVAVLVVGILVLPALEAVLIGNLINRKIGVSRGGSSADGYVEDSQGRIHRIWINR